MSKILAFYNSLLPFKLLGPTNRYHAQPSWIVCSQVHKVLMGLNFVSTSKQLNSKANMCSCFNMYFMVISPTRNLLTKKKCHKMYLSRSIYIYQSSPRVNSNNLINRFLWKNFVHTQVYQRSHQKRVLMSIAEQSL